MAVNVALEINLLKTLTNIDIMEKVIKVLMLLPSSHIKCIKIIFTVKMDNVLSHCNIGF